MEKIIILNDIHLRSDYVVGFLDAQVNTLLKLVNEKRPNAVVINGDIFHKRSPKAAELLAFQKLLDGLKTKRILVNRGNHDTVSKSNTTDSVLSLFANDKVEVITEAKVVHICGMDFLFSPHYESEELILKDLKKYPDIPVFGHWGYQGCVAVRGRAYESLIKYGDIKDRYCFMGHLHTPVEKGKSYVTGTQYSVSFGESNSDKFLHEIIIKDGKIDSVIRLPINFGIRHLSGSFEDIEKLLQKFSPNNFFLLVRVEVDKFELAVEKQLYDLFTQKYSVNHLEFAVSSKIPELEDGELIDPSNMDGQTLDSMINTYVSLNAKEQESELLEFYNKEIKNL